MADDIVARLRARRLVSKDEAAAALEQRDAEIARLSAEVASLRLTLGGRTFDATVPEPIGCPCPGACMTVAEIARLREALRSAEDLARQYASHYSPGSDGRNTFTILADAIAARAALSGEAQRDG